MKDRDKREGAFSLVPSNLDKKGKVCSYSARLTHNQVLDEDAVISEMCEEFNLPKNRVVQNLQQISDYLVSRIKKGYQVTFGGFTVGLSISGKFDATRMDLRFDGEIAAGSYQIVLRRMNADGKSYALARLKAEVVG